MRLFIGLVLGTFLLVVAISFKSFPIYATSNPTQDYAQYLWSVHHQERPEPTDILTQLPTKNDVVTGEMISYGNLGGKPINGYLASPIKRDRPLPGIIIIHEWWGLNDNIKAMTRQIADQGYNALAVDLYEGEFADTPEKARELVTNAQNNSDRLKQNLMLAYQYLEQTQKAPKIASLGWCFGGSWSLKTALLFPDKLDAAVIYYGGELETNPEVLKPLQMPILGIFGELDQRPSPEMVNSFETALKSLNKQAEIYIYPNADHAFANPSGQRYNPEAAIDAWEKTLQFLSKHLN
ncbi:dienelactone hydrolase family protein [Crocosphaera sp. UHCC 0190]|uniref:dienelactone hydrolase family protein n=1 Tax=Crocosphaera sp. UHCC 0190 TaxID=3110246 RepID=UPI002B1F4FF3|nr:dienelactone hydrolase family protein [Crocosphaera sp. UHCC 0190]MEA5509150.1 dienelactone hydrolase family protein [Crocosphaera sp. UHCC 0190]